MKWPNTHYLSRRQVREVGRRLRAAGYQVRTKDLDAYVINIERYAAGADPEARQEVREIIKSVIR